MAERYPGGVISKTPPTVTPPVAGEGGSASGVWTLDTVLEYEKAGAWPKKTLSRELYAWGYNNNGQLGVGNITSNSSPVQVGALTTWNVIEANKVNTANRGFVLAILTNKSLYAWGRNLNGQLGNGTILSRSSPVQVGALTNWATCSGGQDHSLAIKTDGTLWAWGDNSDGQLGNNTSGAGADRSSPIQIGALTNWAQVSGFGGANSIAVKTDGTLWSWGQNGDGQLGSNSLISRSSPVQVGALTNWATVSAGTQHCIAIKTNGTLWGWGLNTNGQIGDGSDYSRSSPVQVGALTDWQQSSAGLRESLVVKTNGTLWGWGNNYSGQLGLGNTIHRSSPVQVGLLTNWSSISCGRINTAAIKTDGTLWTWGKGINGGLGDNSVVNRSSPIQVGSLTTWFKVSAGSYFALARTQA